MSIKKTFYGFTKKQENCNRIDILFNYLQDKKIRLHYTKRIYSFQKLIGNCKIL